MKIDIFNGLKNARLKLQKQFLRSVIVFTAASSIILFTMAASGFTFNPGIAYDVPAIIINTGQINECAYEACETTLNLKKSAVNLNCASKLNWEVSIIDEAGFKVYGPTKFSRTDDITIEATLEVGSYSINYTISNFCNTTINESDDLVITDCKEPTPLCITVISSIVIPEQGYVDVWAIDFEIKSEDNCTDFDALRYTFSDLHPDQDPRYDSDKRSSFARIGCQGYEVDTALQNGRFLLSSFPLHIWDETGNYTECAVWARVDDTNNICPDVTSSSGLVAGKIKTIGQEPMTGVEVELNSTYPESPNTTITNNEGQFEFSDQEPSISYSLAANKDAPAINGVSTLDIALMLKHILGIQSLTQAEYQIAADVNRDLKLSAVDIVLLRKIILGQIDQFPENNSWIFLDAATNLEEEEGPWIYSENIVLNDLQEDNSKLEFTGIKLGDVSGNAMPNATGNIDIRSKEKIEFTTYDKFVEKGEQIVVPLSVPKEIEFHGLQMTIEHPGLELVSINPGAITLDDEHFAKYGNILTMSYAIAQPQKITGDLFYLQFEVKETGLLSEMIELNSSKTEAEIYLGSKLITNKLGLTFTKISPESTIQLYQNRPNPFSEKTSIEFNIPQKANVQLSVFNIAGNEIFRYSKDFNPGLNSVDISNKELKKSGIYYYRITTENFSSIRRMIFIK